MHHRKRVIVQYTTCLAKKEGREEIKLIREGLRVLFAKPFSNGGVYIAPEEETDKEKIPVLFPGLTNNSYS